MPADGYWGRSGSRLQDWKRHGFSVRTYSRPGGDTILRLGLVIQTHYKDQETSLSGSYTEYDVLMHDSNLVFNHLPAMAQRTSENSADEVVLVSASSIPDLSDPASATQNFLASDGDLVVVAYLDMHNPIILGTVNHLKTNEDTATWSATSSDEDIRAVHHNGMKAAVNKDGDVSINLPADREAIISIDGNQALVLSMTTGAMQVELAGGGQKVVLGDDFISWLNTNYGGHTHSSPAGGSTGPPATGAPPTITALASDFLSNRVETE